jgi:hypothetical protein
MDTLILGWSLDKKREENVQSKRNVKSFTEVEVFTL